MVPVDDRARRAPARTADASHARVEIVALADAIRCLMSDSAAPVLTALERARWQGGLVALETVLGQPPSSVDGDAARDIAQLANDSGDEIL